ncbi:MAG: amino acid decarboxylase, partial [Gemmatimonadetes bacterium]|nr:amino acid decarboxylase [Gemmatimonadota bacterium]
FRALKAWMVLRAFGRSGIEARIREHCRLAALFAACVEAAAGFSLAAPPSMAVVCFRVQPLGWSDNDVDRLNESVVNAVNASGAAYLTHTRLAGRSAMRVGIGNVLTTEEHVRAVWDRVASESRRLAAIFSR